MKQNSTIDYLSCILFKTVSFFTGFLPFNLSLFLGRRLGDLIYFFDIKHRVIAYSNIRKAFSGDPDCRKFKKIIRRSYQAFGQNLIEISFIPHINKEYFNKYIQMENIDNIEAAFRTGKGVIFLAVHEGNWELSNIICANLGFPFVLFVRDQGFVKLNALLNSYRLKQGAKIIHKNTGIRQLIEVLKSNQAVGMTLDQGGKRGQIVNFFAKEASMATGAVKLALKYDCAIIPVFYTRIKGPHTKVILDQVYTVTRTGNFDADLKNNLQNLTGIYEKYIRQYPHEYLWTYKIWKYGKQKDILILSDAKAGHLRQSEAAAGLISQQLADKQIKSNISVCQVKFRSKLSKFIFNLSVVFSGKYQCQGCMGCLRYALTQESYQQLLSLRPDIIVSAGSSISAVNFLLSRQNQAKSVLLMRPSLLSLNKFDLAIIPEHDRPSKKKNVVITEGALNPVNKDYLSQKAEGLVGSGLLKGGLSNLCIGVLIGGNSKGFSISREQITGLCVQIKKAAEALNAGILITTSRRTPPEVEQALKKEFTGYPYLKLLVIANENNNQFVSGGILGLSNIIISSPDSISMISESVLAQKYVFVFEAKGLDKKHRRFLRNYQDRKYIYLGSIDQLSTNLEKVWKDKPEINSPKDNLKVIEALKRII